MKLGYSVSHGCRMSPFFLWAEADRETDKGRDSRFGIWISVWELYVWHFVCDWQAGNLWQENEGYYLNASHLSHLLLFLPWPEALKFAVYSKPNWIWCLRAGKMMGFKPERGAITACWNVTSGLWACVLFDFFRITLALVNLYAWFLFLRICQLVLVPTESNESIIQRLHYT